MNFLLVIYDGGKFRFFALNFASSGERIQELVKSAFHDFPLDFVRLIVLERLTACVKAICWNIQLKLQWNWDFPSILFILLWLKLKLPALKFSFLEINSVETILAVSRRFLLDFKKVFPKSFPSREDLPCFFIDKF